MQDRFQILCLDGGGIKGLFSAALLAKLEEDLNININDHFDLIVGTSTGGIIALGLGVGLSPRKLVEFYFKRGPKIFKNIPGLMGIKNLVMPKYSGKKLEGIFQEDDLFGEMLLGNSKKRLVIPSYNIDAGDVHLFKTAHHKRFRTDYRIPMWKIARSTAAAPTYFPISRIVDSMRLIDGGVWANNPAMVGVVEAISVLDVTIDNIHMLSIGTTEDLGKMSGILDVFGGWPMWGGKAIELIMQAQSVSIQKQVSLLLGNRLERVNPKVPKGLFKLDKLNMEELFSYASKYSRDFSPIFQKQFINHRADNFEPIYKI